MNGNPSEQPEQRELKFQINVPPALENGAYANFLAVWHTAYEFTLDFAVTQQPQMPQEGDEDSPVQVPCNVVARVKIPVGVVFDVLRALNDNMTRYEQTFGTISRPEQREEAPESP